MVVLFSKYTYIKYTRAIEMKKKIKLFYKLVTTKLSFKWLFCANSGLLKRFRLCSGLN